MKKLVSIILATILIAGAMVTAGAYDPYPPQEELAYQFEDKFVERYCATYDQIKNFYRYDELYYHYDENGEIDWCLVCIQGTGFLPADIKYLRIDDFVLISSSGHFFDMMYGIYDVAADKFIDIVDCYNELGKYEGVEDALRVVPQSRPIGDYDYDYRLSILDATGIQRMLAKLDSFKYGFYSDRFGNMGDFADIDGDGKISILDATAIQRKLAMLDSEPVVNEEIVLHAIDDSDEFWNLESMPDEATTLDFTMEYDKQQFNNVIYNIGVEGEWAALAIIKSNEQYDIVFNDRAPEFTDEFFESKWLVVTIKYCGCHEATASITDIANNGDTLYVIANTYTPDGPISPTTPRWLSMVSVDKNLLYDVNNIVLVK